MSINVILRKISNLPGRSDRKVELSFRGFTHKTRVLQCENLAIFNEDFRWPHYGKDIRDEVLSVSVYNCSKVFSNRLLGRLDVSLQHAVAAGRLLLREPLTDGNFYLTEIYVELDIRYLPLEGSVGQWDGSDYLKAANNRRTDLVIQNEGFEDDTDGLSVDGDKLASRPPPILTRPDPLDRAARQLGRSLLKSGDEDDDDDDAYYDDDDEYDDLVDIDDNVIYTPLLSRCKPLRRSVVAQTPKVRSFQVNINILEAQKLVGVNISPAVFIKVGDQKKHTATQKSTNCPFYNENFQFEFQETPEIMFDKVIAIKVFHRKTLGFLMTHIGTFKIDISTVYGQPDHRFYQKWAPLTDPSDTRSGIKGYVKASISVLMKGDPPSTATLSTSGASEDIEKNLMLPCGMTAERPWAKFRVRIYRAEGLPTMDAGLMAKMAKVTDRTVFIDSYVQVTFAGQQGETSVASATSYPVWNEEISFIEQFPPLAQRIRVQILDDAKMGDVALATHFLDLQQISDPTRNGFNPTFGPAWVNLYGSPQNSTLGDVHQALNQGVGKGIFYRGRILLALSVEIYSSPASSATDTTSTAVGKVKGVLSRLTMKRKSKKGKNASDSPASTATGDDSGESGVEVPESITVETEDVHPLPEACLGERHDFLVFASIFEVTMMDSSIGTKPVTFELSIGNFGKVVNFSKSSKSQSREDLARSREELRRSREELARTREELLKNRDDFGEEALQLIESDDDLDRLDEIYAELGNRSTTDPMRPQPTEYDRSFYCIPLHAPFVREKPCLYIWAPFEDHNYRLYQANWLSKMADRLELGLNEVESLLRRPRSNLKERLVNVLMELVASCKQFSFFSDKRSQCRPNRLDCCRRDFIKKNLASVARQAARARRRITRRNAKQRIADVRKLLKILRLLAQEPQSTIPDVFLWLLSGGKRVAYVRIPAYTIMFSLVEEQKGQDCGRLSTLYMKSPDGTTSEIFAKLEVYLWLGLAKYSKEAIESIPEEFMPMYEEELEQEQELREEDEGKYGPPLRKKLPVSLSCQDSRYFQLRCHLYQGRGLMAADADGLSDPFAKVVFSSQCQVTRVAPDTLSPAWCECLWFDRVLLEGSIEDLKRDPPLIIINFFDHDKMGRPTPLGRAFAEAEFKTVDQWYKKPQLRFHDISLGRAAAGELLAAFELIELDYSGFGEPTLPSSVDPQELTYVEDKQIFLIPAGVQPVLRTFRIEVLFWGLRDLKRVQLFEVDRPLVRVECGGKQLESEEIQDFKGHPNFKEVSRFLHVELPEQTYLHPPLTLFVVEHRAFGRVALVGSYVVQSLMDYTPRELMEEPEEEDDEPKPLRERSSFVKASFTKKKPSLISVKSIKLTNLSIAHSKISMKLKDPFKKLRKTDEELEEEEPEVEELDWWSKYYASLDELDRLAAELLEKQERAEMDAGNVTFANMEDEDEDNDAVVVEMEPPKRKKMATLKLYGGELENEFSQFQDWLKIFPLFKGSAVGEDNEDDEEERMMGKCKGSFLVYPIDDDDEENSKCLITNGLPNNSPLKILVRVYVVKATTLSPTDPNGKADPYLALRIGQQTLDTKDKYIPKQLNPVFGEVFEFTVSFPLETELAVTVMDHDMVGADDVIGETRVDLENRFYSRHRATCGLALYYDTSGYNMWRDITRPAAILAELCKKNGIPAPEYRSMQVKVSNRVFKIPPDAVPEDLQKKNPLTPEDLEEIEEHSALHVLHHWAEMTKILPGTLALVPEHVEIRPLMNNSKPGLPQGYLHMWLDMFPTDIPAPPPVDIKPRLPVQYELRVIIWNTDDVILDDVNPFTGDPTSDIYVKGWIKGLDGEKQETDVHFSSLTGEGNFNWRFVFRFDYLPSEKEVVYKKKESIFSLEESEFRQPAILTLQVWDYDRISANDFLGAVELRLSDMVRGAKSADKCSVRMAKDRASPRVSIFRSKKMKGWWPLTRIKTAEEIEKEEREREKEEKKGGKKPKTKEKRSKLKKEDLEFTDSSGNVVMLLGKVEAELQLVTLEQAEANPVGRARKEPEPLEKPNRPTTSFSWFVNPMKTFIYLIWAKFKKFIIALIILAILGLFLGLLVYTVPQQISALLISG